MPKPKKETCWQVWFNDPGSPGWDWWGNSKTEEEAREDVEFCRKYHPSFQLHIIGPVVYPPLKKGKA